MIRKNKLTFLFLLTISYSINIAIAQNNIIQETALQFKERLGVELLNQADSGNVEQIKLLIEYGANPNTTTWDGFTPLMYASHNGHYLTARELIAYGANLNMATSMNLTALHYASINNHDSIAELLILNGANVHPVNQDGVSPIHFSATYGYPFLTDLLIYYGAHIDSTDRFGNTPLITAVYSGTLTITNLLLEQWADVNKPDRKGYTPLMIAAQFNDTIIMKLLLDYGANINERNKNGIDALALAINSRAEDAASLLIKLGAAKEMFYQEVSYTDLAQTKNFNTIVNELKQLGVTLSSKPRVTNHRIYSGSGFSNKDFFFIFGTELHIARYGASIGLDYAFRPFNKAVLLTNEYAYYQFREKRKFASLNINYNLFNRYYDIYSKASVRLGLKHIYSWAKFSYKNAVAIPDSYFRISPSIDLNYERGNFFTTAQVYFYSMEQNKKQPVFINLSIGYSINKMNLIVKPKKIEW